ncbi:MAG: hypothetical protein KME07_25290 [Pegethrix bostrychoides GSE-TBD4-15B]|uniref:Uncharacterized protein n=1 Tax=Pegethrix bostrychoides GSE-TBD4-15B TaxID=2839662 RepID=A0A951PGP1_9CYAN|nr:hypothetical protein [Pegethrix bostrychoides GSE-TBD4-15B]
MLLEQQGGDLVIRFESEVALTITLQNFSLENLDNLSVATSAAVTVGNLLFASETAIQDQFDVINSDQTLEQVLRPNIVTFLNGLDNITQGLENSDDIIDGQAGNDRLAGLSGNDKLRGGQGNDALWGGTGDDILSGGAGLNQLNGGSGSDQFVLSQLGTAIIQDFVVAEDWLSWENQNALGQISAQLSGQNTVLLYAGQTVATLLNVQVTDITLLFTRT